MHNVLSHFHNIYQKMWLTEKQKKRSASVYIPKSAGRITTEQENSWTASAISKVRTKIPSE